MQSEQLTKLPMTKKATVLFPFDLFNELEKLAKAQRTSVSELVRMAVREHYALKSYSKRLKMAEKLKIVEEMRKADFPFRNWQEMEKDYEETFFG
jgi:hypothetical protein